MNKTTYDDKIGTYVETLIKWQKKLNLISPDTVLNIKERHIDDSKTLLDLVPKDKLILDIGSGAGFPGMILGIYGYTIHLLDSDYRKCSFLKEVIRILNLSHVTVHNCRIEDYIGPLPEILTSRALAPLDKLLDFFKIVSRETSCTGFFHKGTKWKEEICQAEKKWIFDKEVFSNANGSVILKVTNVHLRPKE